MTLAKQNDTDKTQPQQHTETNSKNKMNHQKAEGDLESLDPRPLIEHNTTTHRHNIKTAKPENHQEAKGDLNSIDPRPETEHNT